MLKHGLGRSTSSRKGIRERHHRLIRAQRLTKPCALLAIAHAARVKLALDDSAHRQTRAVLADLKPAATSHDRTRRIAASARS